MVDRDLRDELLDAELVELETPVPLIHADPDDQRLGERPEPRDSPAGMRLAVEARVTAMGTGGWTPRIEPAPSRRRKAARRGVPGLASGSWGGERPSPSVMSRCAPPDGATPTSVAPDAPLCWLRSTRGGRRFSWWSRMPTRRSGSPIVDTSWKPGASFSTTGARRCATIPRSGPPTWAASADWRGRRTSWTFRFPKKCR